ncbi:PREDICTED: uncharacterized protein LOC106751419 [Dinoponera quadriceps]|uniref:Uncharacterized protein LOC106751419 n=1 Tax=Dinoponera quadriceps TaxID=609295 RepID=A0A6P3YBN0_DINQU|nr:PREDICTED: uncharacterized protein LOC106751419 [Dinoponera quadriceps]
MNSLVITFVFHACGQIEILCDALNDFSSSKCNQRLTSSIAGELVNKHQKIISFSEKIERIFCYIALIQVMLSSLVMCCLGYMLVTKISKSQEVGSIDNKVLIKVAMCYMAAYYASVEAFMFCFCGEYLITKVGTAQSIPLSLILT